VAIEKIKRGDTSCRQSVAANVSGTGVPETGLEVVITDGFVVRRARVKGGVDA
jgi:hypothetical protein